MNDTALVAASDEKSCQLVEEFGTLSRKKNFKRNWNKCHEVHKWDW